MHRLRTGCRTAALFPHQPGRNQKASPQRKCLTIQGEYDKSLICDPELRTLIERMLTTNRRLRFTAKELFKNQFFEGMQDGSAYF